MQDWAGQEPLVFIAVSRAADVTSRLQDEILDKLIALDRLLLPASVADRIDAGPPRATDDRMLDSLSFLHTLFDLPALDDHLGAESRVTKDHMVLSDVPSHIPAPSPENLATPQMNGQHGHNFLMYRLLEAFVNKRQGSTRWVPSHRSRRRRSVPFRMALSPAS